MKNNVKEDNIHIALSVYDLADDYLRHACTTITSILENTSKRTVIHLLLYDNIQQKKEEHMAYENNKKRLASLRDKYDVEICYHQVSIPQWYLDIPAMKSYHIGTLLRLFIPEVLDNINKVIYLDCDVIVTLDIAELWEIDLEDYPLAACPDPYFPKSLGLKYYIPKIKKLYHHLLPRTPYFNAGVLILNLKSMRENTLLSLFASKYLEKFPYAPFSDQDVLNAYCKGKYIKLDKNTILFQIKF